MRQYRIVTKLRKNGEEHFQIQQKVLWFWFNVEVADGYWGREYYYCVEDAERQLLTFVREDEAAVALKKKHKAFKSKVVYGPYPP